MVFSLSQLILIIISVGNDLQSRDRGCGDIFEKQVISDGNMAQNHLNHSNNHREKKKKIIAQLIGGVVRG